MHTSFFSFLRKSFYVKAILFMSLILSVPLVVLAYLTVNVSNRAVMGEVNKLNYQIVTQVRDSIDTTLNRMNQLSTQYGFSPLILDSIETPSVTYEDTLKKRQLIRTLDAGQVVIGEVQDISLYSRVTGEIISSEEAPSTLENFRYRSAIEQLINSGREYQLIDNGMADDTLFFVRKIPFNSGNAYTSVLVIALPNDSLKKIISSIDLRPAGAVHILTTDGKAIVTTSKLTGRELEEQLKSLVARWQEENQKTQFQLDESLVSVRQSEHVNGWLIVSKIPIEQLTSSARFVGKTVVWFLVVLFAFGLIGALGFGYHLYKPLQQLKRHMKKIEQGHFDAVVRPYPNNEVGEIGIMLKRMASRLHHLVDELQVTEELKRRNEIRALQSQINPHFMYNTLNTIRMFAMLKDYAKINQMMGKLTSLLRYSMENFEQMVPLTRELEYVEDYLELIRLRYDADVAFLSEIEEPYGTMYIPKLFLQPLIENSLFHGILCKEPAKGTITLRVVSSYDKIEIQVEDDGKGMERTRLEEVKNDLASRHAEESIGIKNVRDRLNLLHGDRAEMHLSSQPDVGTKVIIVIPREQVRIEQEEGHVPL